MFNMQFVRVGLVHFKPSTIIFIYSFIYLFIYFLGVCGGGGRGGGGGGGNTYILPFSTFFTIWKNPIQNYFLAYFLCLSVNHEPIFCGSI